MKLSIVFIASFLSFASSRGETSKREGAKTWETTHSCCKDEERRHGNCSVAGVIGRKIDSRGYNLQSRGSLHQFVRKDIY